MAIKVIDSLKQAMPKIMLREGRYEQSMYFSRPEALRAAERLQNMHGGTVYIERPLPGSKIWWVFYKK